MARKVTPPRYCKHTATGRGYARFRVIGTPDYQFVYFPGPHNSAESLAAYAAAVAHWSQHGTPPPRAEAAPDAGAVTVGRLLLEFWDYLRQHQPYQKGGRPTSEVRCLKDAFRPLAEHFADHPVSRFGIEQMDSLRLTMIARGWADSTVRKHLSRCRSLFAWGQERGLVPDAVRLVARKGLGVKKAPQGRRTPKKRPPDPFAVGAVQLVACPPVRAMIWLQWLNGIRPGGVCALRPCDVDRSGELWVYSEPEESAAKTGREVHTLGPRAQAVLRPWLDACPRPDAPVFRAPGARTREGYLVGHYRDYVADLCQRLGVPHWHPNQLRHFHGTRVRRLYGIEAARARLGHTNVGTTEIYAEQDFELVRRIAREIG